VTSNATPTEIRQAYLHLARRCHPDKNPDDREATKTFQRIQAAYVALNEVQCGQNREVLLSEELGEVLSEERGEVLSEERGEEIPELGGEEIPELGKEEIPEQGEEETPELGDEETPELGDEETPELGDEETPELGEEEIPQLGEEEIPETGEEEIPEIGEDIKRNAHFPMRIPGNCELMDSDTGFHTVFRKLFQEISKWEMKSKENTDNLPPPSFGGSSTTLKNVNKFYEYWTKFSTKMYVETKDNQDWLLIPDKTPSKHCLKSLQRDRKKFNMDIQYLVKLIKKQDQRLKSFPWPLKYPARKTGHKNAYLEYTEVSAGAQGHGLGKQLAFDLEWTTNFHFLQQWNFLSTHHDEGVVQEAAEALAFSHL
ncbi:DnaJ subfamily C member 21-like 7, partial [Homarus americanus]